MGSIRAEVGSIWAEIHLIRAKVGPIGEDIGQQGLKLEKRGEHVYRFRLIYDIFVTRCSLEVERA